MSIPASANVCLYLYNALKSLGVPNKKVIATYYCYGDPIPQQTGGGPKGWDFFGPYQNQLVDTPESKVLREVMGAYVKGQNLYTGVLTAGQAAYKLSYSEAP